MSGKLLDGELNPLFGSLSLNGLVTLDLENVAHELSVFLVVFMMMRISSFAIRVRIILPQRR